MKKTIFYILSVIFLASTSCETDVELIIIKDGSPSVLSSDLDPAAVLTLTAQEADSVVYGLDWTIVDYIEGDTSTVLASYALEVNTVSASEPVVIYPPEYLHYDFHGVELNTTIMEQLGGVAGESIDVSFKIVSTFNDDVLSSNTVTNTFIPYPLIPSPAVFPPITDLYLTGPAAEIGWPLTTKFTKVNETLYTLSAFLKGNKRMEFVTENWLQAYKIPSDVNPEDVLYEGVFVEDGDQAHDAYGNVVSRWEAQEFLSPPEDGIYTIMLDFQSGIYTIEKGAKSAVYLPTGGDIYLYGKAVGSPWPIPETLKMTQETEMRYSIVHYLIGGKNYNFLADGAWNQVYKVPAGIDVNTVIYKGSFVEDGDLAHDEYGNEVSRWENQTFLAPPESGTYKLTLDFLTGTYDVEKQE